jgi:hypothetical protein
VLKGPISIMDVVAWCAGTRGVPAQPAGYSDGGLETGTTTGPQQTAWASHLLTNWCGDDGFVQQLRVDHATLAPLGDTVWWEGEVTERAPCAHGGGTVGLAIRARNQLGADIATGEAKVVLPSRAHGTVALPLTDDGGAR